MPECRACGKEIVWVTTKNGKQMPLNPPILNVVTEGCETIKGRISHYATCKQADEWRGKTREQMDMDL